MKKILINIWPILVIALVIFIFFARLFIPEPSIFVTPDFGRSDSWHFSIANKYYYAQELKKNRIPIWNPHIGMGFPTLAEGQTAVFFLPNLIFFRTLPFVWAYNLTLVLSFIGAGVGTYLFCRSLNLSKLAAVYAGIIFPLGGFFVFHVQHHNLLQTASIMPWLFWAVNEFLKTKKIIFLLGLSILVSQQIFAGFPQLTFYSLVALYIYVFLKCLFAKISKFKIILLITTSVMLGFMLSAIQLLPSYELLQLSTKQSDPKSILTQFPYTYKNLLQFLDPFILGSPKDGTYPRWIPGQWGIFWESIAYVGIIPLAGAIALILVNLSRKTKYKKDVIIFASLAGLALILALGVNAPLHVIFSIPPFSLFRVPSRFLLIVQFSLSILASMYLQRFYRKKILSLLIIFASIANIFIIFLNYNPLGLAKEWFKPPETTKYLKDNNTRILSFGYFKQWSEYFLNNGWNNTDFYYKARNSLDQNSNLIFSYNKFDAYESIATRRFSLIDNFIDSNLADKNNVTNSKVLKFLSKQNVRYVISPYDFKENKDLKLIEKKSGQNPFNIYEVFFEPQRYFMVNDYQIAKTVAEANKILSSENFNPEQTIILETEPEIISNSSGVDYRISIIEETPTKIVLKTEQNKKAILVLSDSFYPGWTAIIDNKKTPIIPANINSRGVVLDEGIHLVKLVYKPMVLEKTFVISLGAFLIFLITFVKFKEIKIN